MSLFAGIAKTFSRMCTQTLLFCFFIQRMIEIFAIRWFLGMFESAMLPGVVREFLLYIFLIAHI